MHRRQLIKTLGMFLGVGATGGLKFAEAAESIAAPSGRVLRIAHLTDVHISDDKDAIAGLERCFNFLQNLSDPPDIIINGGDTINDGLYRSRNEVRDQWKVWHSVHKYNSSLPMHYCLGNHDIWGLYNPGKDAMTGKRFAMDLMQVDKQYRSFDVAGWHFIVLDSTQKKKNGLWYTAKLDEEQMDWLEQDLKATPSTTPIAVVSHIPILCANVFMDDYKVRYGKFHLPATWIHTDVKEITNLFANYSNIKFCLSGHMHMADKVQVNNIWYYCNGAVSGDWWRNDTYKGTKAGFAMLDLFDNGEHNHSYIPYV